MKSPRRREGERGFALLIVFLMAAAVALMLYQQMPRVAFESQRDKEELLIERGEQYKRAIQLYFVAFKKYPSKIEDLESTNNQRFLRRRFIDPMTGKKEWRLVHVNGGGQLTDSLVTKPPATGPGDNKSQTPDGSSASSTPAPTDPNAPPDVNAAVLRRPSDRPLTPLPGAPDASQNGGQQPGFVPQFPGQQFPGQQFPGQPIAGQTYPGQTYPGQTYPGQTFPGQGVPGQIQNVPNPTFPGQGFPGQGFPGQGFPGQTFAGQPLPGQNLPGQSPDQQSNNGQQFNPGQPFNAGQTFPGQPGQPGFNPQDPNNTNGFAGQQALQQALTGQGANFAGANLNSSTFANPGANNPGLGQGQQTNPALEAIGNQLRTPRQAPAPVAANTPVNAGGLAGVASTQEGPSIKVYKDRSKYNEWEFIFDLKQGLPGQPAPGAPAPGSNPLGNPLSNNPGAPGGSGLPGLNLPGSNTPGANMPTPNR